MPTNTKHTPGPWIVDPCQPYVVIPAAVETEKGGYIAEAAGDDCAQQQANARLMAAVPELLEALEELLHAPDPDEVEDFTPLYRAITKAHAAIAKAKGA